MDYIIISNIIEVFIIAYLLYRIDKNTKSITEIAKILLENNKKQR